MACFKYYENKITIFDIKTGKNVCTVEVKHQVGELRFSPNKQFVAILARKQHENCYTTALIETGETLSEAPAKDMLWTNDNRICRLSSDGFVKINSDFSI